MNIKVYNNLKILSPNSVDLMKTISNQSISINVEISCRKEIQKIKIRSKFFIDKC